MFEQLSVEAHVYRGDELVCACALVTIVNDARLGLRASEARRHIAVRFVDGVEPGLRGQLAALLRTRGARCSRLAETIAPIELVVRDGHGTHRRVTCRLDPPTMRNGLLEEIDFRVREARGVAKGSPGDNGQRRPVRRATPERLRVETST